MLMLRCVSASLLLIAALAPLVAAAGVADFYANQYTGLVRIPLFISIKYLCDTRELVPFSCNPLPSVVFVDGADLLSGAVESRLLAGYVLWPNKRWRLLSSPSQRSQHRNCTTH